jgi:transcription elongation GreA/GreB family factor
MQIAARLAAAVMALSAIAAPAFAQIVSAKGAAATQYTGRLTADVRANTARQAELNALERYIAESNPAKQRLFDRARQSLLASLDSYVLNTVTLSETDDAKTKTYSLVLKVEINGGRFENALSDATGSSPAQPNGAQVAAIFVARTPSTIQKFDDRVYKREDASVKVASSAQGQRKTRESEGIGASSVSTGDSVSARGSYSQSATATSESGGSVTRKADAVVWTVASANDVDQQMTGVFANAGMEIVPADFIERLDLAAVRRDFGTGNDLSSLTLRNVVAAVRAAGIPILVLGWIDEQMPDTDPVTGNARLNVKVNARVYDVSKPIPRVLASIGPIQYAGLGPSSDVAATNAMKLAAEDAARKLVDEISVKGVR